MWSSNCFIWYWLLKRMIKYAKTYNDAFLKHPLRFKQKWHCVCCSFSTWWDVFLRFISYIRGSSSHVCFCVLLYFYLTIIPIYHNILRLHNNVYNSVRERLDILEGYIRCKIIPQRLYTNILTLRLSNEVK